MWFVWHWIPGKNVLYITKFRPQDEGNDRLSQDYEKSADYYII